MDRERTTLPLGPAAIVVAAIFLASAAPGWAVTGAGSTVKRVTWMKGFRAAGTPQNLDRVGVLKLGRREARNVLVLNPGTSAGSAYFAPLARTLVSKLHDWQVWSVERRENLLEDHSMLNKAKRGEATPEQLNDYYLGWITDPSITAHFRPIPDSEVAFARRWGMRVEVNDLRRVVLAARRHGRRVVLGGHSLGGSITTAYATWDFHGTAGVRSLAGLVYIDGGSSPTPVTPEDAQQELDDLEGSTPWLAFGGIPAPFLGLFSSGGATLAKIDPSGLSIGQQSPLLPANLKPPVPATNEAQFGYAVDTDTSPPNLLAAQVHTGQLASSGNPRPWVRAGEITPIQRYAATLSGTGLLSTDGVAWYHPMRLTIDAGAVGDGTVTRLNPCSTSGQPTATTSTSRSTPSPPPSAASESSTPPRPSPASHISPGGSSPWSTGAPPTPTTTRARPFRRTPSSATWSRS